MLAVMPRSRLIPPLLILALCTGPATAQSAASARALLADGQWQEAARRATALGTAEGYALAAEALTHGGGLVPDNQKKAVFQQAQEQARKAITAAPNDPEGYLRLAVAQGRLAQFVGILESLGMAKEVRANLERAIRLGMNTAPPYVGLGVWHATIISKGSLAAAVAGAKRSDALEAFKKALALEPENLTARLEYANALLLLDSRGNRAAAVAQLQKAVTLTPVDFWQRRDLDAARAQLARLQ